jgi:hypothetical protein
MQRWRRFVMRGSFSTHSAPANRARDVLCRSMFWCRERGASVVDIRCWNRLSAMCAEALPNTTVFTHLEPIEDPASFQDTALDRVEETKDQH